MLMECTVHYRNSAGFLKFCYFTDTSLSSWKGGFKIFSDISPQMHDFSNHAIGTVIPSF